MKHQASKVRRQAVLIRDAYKCQYCGEPCKSVDHIIPWNWSHNDSLENLVAACVVCNSTAGGTKFPSFLEKKDYILRRRAKQAARKGKRG
jgi:5-methylcytosine-specific restriction endonuclease McrA